ncbi:MAG: hypothetical protein COV34_02225 [Candidatus Zambryskibacteria bacterium CG10_big_fil_rev_8_21_14_0_10_42_12]|uniref:Magnesium transporter CorA n=1 Tax=Candidatus Zambryskibacteria bacterium CG10_big_fil_rev_8_21_14_0_10_42_12 TaxID=1975115 RepID=A0A2H0QVV3_9BACT|nr:MAG: hypothetical protein COV34_02225 [Candidatus Zambryskibacteria bacterium CG10_big_fil_rev_8_21_14_0_10_42_12]
MNTYSYRGVRWLETFAPDEDDLHTIAGEEGLDPFIVRDILAPTPFGYIGEHSDALYAVFHFPVFRLGHSDDKQQELDLVIKDGFLMTVRYDFLEPLEHLATRIRTHEHLSSHHDHQSTYSFHVANAIMKEMYTGVSLDLRAFTDWLHNIEDKIYTGNEREMVSEISLAAREMAEFRSLIHDHEQALKQYEETGIKIFGLQFKESFKEVIREFKNVQRQTRFLSELVTELRETNNSLVTTNQNEIMKVLTIMAFVTFPLSLIAGVFGMNVVDMPVVGQENDFWIIVGAMALGMLIMFIYFRHKRWL